MCRFVVQFRPITRTVDDRYRSRGKNRKCRRMQMHWAWNGSAVAPFAALIGPMGRKKKRSRRSGATRSRREYGDCYLLTQHELVIENTCFAAAHTPTDIRVILVIGWSGEVRRRRVSTKSCIHLALILIWSCRSNCNFTAMSQLMIGKLLDAGSRQ